MNTIGKLTTMMAAAALAGAVVLGVRSIPDIQRYLRMRAM